MNENLYLFRKLPEKKLTIPGITLLSFFLLLSQLFSQNTDTKNYSQTDQLAYEKIHLDNIAAISKNIAEEMNRLKPMLKELKEKYGDAKLHYYTNQYPFCDTDKKTWTKRYEAIVTISDKEIQKIEFIIEAKQNIRGYGFQRTYLTDNSPHDGAFDDIIIEFRDFLIPEASRKTKIGDLTQLDSKSLIYTDLREYYNKLAIAIEKDYFHYLQNKRLQQRSIMGHGVY